MTLRRSTLALAGLALLTQLPAGCCHPRPLFSRAACTNCGPVLSRPLFGGPPAVAIDAGVPVGVPAGVPVGLPAGAPGCASCGGGPVAAAPVGYPAGYPGDGFAHAPGGPAGHVVSGGVPPQFTGYPTTIGQPMPLGNPVVSKELPPPTAMPKQ